MCEIAFVKTKGKGLQLVIYDETLDKNYLCRQDTKADSEVSNTRENLEQSEVSHMAE